MQGHVQARLDQRLRWTTPGPPPGTLRAGQTPGLQSHGPVLLARPHHLRLLRENLILRQLLPFRIASLLAPHHLLFLCPKHSMLCLTRKITGPWRGAPYPLPSLIPTNRNPRTSGRRLARKKKSSIARWYDICTSVRYSSFLSQAQPPEFLDSLLRHCQQVSQEIWPASETNVEESWRSGFDDHADMYVLKSPRLHLVMNVLPQRRPSCPVGPH